jgi:AraC family transcriptional regulator
MQLPEHQHSEAQVEIHFRRPVTSRGHAPLECNLLARETELIAPGRPHIGRWEAGSEVVVILIPPSAFERAADEILVRSRFTILDQELAAEPFIHQLASSLRSQFLASTGVSKLFVESSGYLLAEHILRIYAETAPILSYRERLDEKRLADLLRFIDENLESGLTVADMARAMGMGVHCFARSLRLAKGCTPYQLIQTRRIQLAKLMLREKQMSLAEIGFRLGFATQSHFTAVFHRSTGFTPKAYRQEQWRARMQRRS